MRFLVLLLLSFLSVQAFALIEAVGSDGQKVVLAHPAERVIALAPNLTEMMYAIGAGKRLVAVSADSDYPKAAQSLPHVGGYKTVNNEQLLKLKPDLVVAWQGANSPAIIQELRRLSLNVIVLSAKNMMSIPKDMIVLGRLTAHIGGARGQAHLFQKHYTELVMKYALQKPEVKTLLQLGYPPLYAVASKGLLAHIINLCGGDNIFSNLPEVSAPVNLEAVLEANPQVIIELGNQAGSPWLNWPDLAAVKNKAVVVMNASILARPGPRILDGAQQVCEVLAKVRAQHRKQKLSA